MPPPEASALFCSATHPSLGARSATASLFIFLHFQVCENDHFLEIRYNHFLCYAVFRGPAHVDVPKPTRDTEWDALVQFKILWGYGQMEQSLASSHLAEDALKNLAQLRVATLIGCPF